MKPCRHLAGLVQWRWRAKQEWESQWKARQQCQLFFVAMLDFFARVAIFSEILSLAKVTAGIASGEEKVCPTVVNGRVSLQECL